MTLRGSYAGVGGEVPVDLVLAQYGLDQVEPWNDAGDLAGPEVRMDVRVQAAAAVAKLQDTIRTWVEVDTIRRRLPPHLARQIPPSRLGVVLALARRLAAKGAIRLQGGDSLGSLGAVFIPLVILAGVGIAGAAVIVAVMPAILREHRESVRAKSIAQGLERSASVEKSEAKRIGPAAARERSKERSAEVVSAWQTVPAPAAGGMESFPSLLPSPAGVPSTDPFTGRVGWLAAAVPGLQRYGTMMAVGAAIFVGYQLLKKQKGRR